MFCVNPRVVFTLISMDHPTYKKCTIEVHDLIENLTAPKRIALCMCLLERCVALPIRMNIIATCLQKGCAFLCIVGKHMTTHKCEPCQNFICEIRIPVK